MSTFKRLMLLFVPVMLASAALTACGGDSGNDEVTAFPSPDSSFVNPESNVSFIGASADDLEGIEVSGSESGVLEGELVDHESGDGASFVPAEPFAEGEQVTVSTDLDIVGADGDYEFSTFVSGRATVPPGGLPPEPAVEGVTAGAETASKFVSEPKLDPPPVTVNTPAKDGTAEGYYFVAPKNDGLMIVDQKGELVWFQPGLVADFRVQEFNDEPVLTYWTGDFTTILAGFANGRFEILDENYEPVATVQAKNGYQGNLHEFNITEDGTVLISIYEPVRTDLTKAGGSKDGIAMDSIVQEIDLETGEVLFEWHSLDHVPVEESAIEPTPDSSFDYFHINSIKEDSDGNLLVSARNTSGVYKVDRQTGEVIWTLGGKGSDFELDKESTFSFQHDAERTDEGYISLFDNAAFMPGPDGAIRDQSRGLVLDIDEENGTVEIVREYEHDGYLSPTQGNVDAQDNDNVVVGWGSTPAWTEFTEDGDILFDAGVTARNSSYRVYKSEWTGTPTAKPSLAASDGSLFVSWNGTTETASWQVMTGADADSLESTGDPVDKDGFETELSMPGDTGAVVAVAALDEDGETLSTSDPIQVGGGNK
ncbi:MAG: arylsulfotransferase family protein [Solirubrobacterales bacterium]